MFIIAATNTFVRFIHFEFGHSYGEYLDTSNESDQKSLVESRGEESCVRMQSTRWVNLQSAEGRRRALCHLSALLKWYEDQRALSSQDVYDSSEDEGDISMSDDEYIE